MKYTIGNVVTHRCYICLCKEGGVDIKEYIHQRQQGAVENSIVDKICTIVGTPKKCVRIGYIYVCRHCLLDYIENE